MTNPKVALVTGSGKRRVGNSVAQALADRGYAIVLHYLSSEQAARETASELSTRGVDVRAIRADLTQEDEVRKLVDEAAEWRGRLDVLVTSAADWKPKRLEDVSAADVREQFDLNTLGTFLCVQHAGLKMVRQPEGGSIITIGDWSIERPYANYAAYFVSKGAIPTITRSMAVELGLRNPRVRVNCILPGPVMLSADVSPAERDAVKNLLLVKREGRPDFVAHAVVFLVENEFVTGVCLPVDGGRTVYAGTEPASI